MLFSQIIPPSPFPIESKSLSYTSVSLFLFLGYFNQVKEQSKWLTLTECDGRDLLQGQGCSKAPGNVHTARFAGVQGLQREDGMASVHPALSYAPGGQESSWGRGWAKMLPERGGTVQPSSPIHSKPICP